MIPFQERKKLRKIMYSKVSLVVLFIVLVATGKGSWDVHQKAVLAQTELDITERSLVDLRSRTTELQASLIRLGSNQGIEAEVRQKYTVVRPGEEVVVVVDDNVKKSENGNAADTRSMFDRVLIFLGF